MAMANAKLVNGAVTISTDFVHFYIFQQGCTDALTIAGLRYEACHLHLQSRVQNIKSGLHMKQCAIHPFLQKQFTRSITVCV